MMSERIQCADIFVVDDERVIGQTLGIILRQAGYDVRVYEDPCAAVSELTAKPRLLISDQQMPGLSGCELASLVTVEAPQTKVLLFSSSLLQSDPEWMALKLLSREARLLAKPLHPTHLVSCVREMIGSPISHKAGAMVGVLEPQAYLQVRREESLERVMRPEMLLHEHQEEPDERPSTLPKIRISAPIPSPVDRIAFVLCA